MDPERMISRLDGLADRVAVLANNIRTQARMVSGRWERLGEVGGQRADHAAALMADLMEPLLDLHVFTGDVRSQIMQMRNDPFCEECSTGRA